MRRRISIRGCVGPYVRPSVVPSVSIKEKRGLGASYVGYPALLTLAFTISCPALSFSLSFCSFDALITGKPTGKGSRFSSEPKPWNEVLIAEGDYTNWTLTIKPKKMGDEWKKTISEFKNFRLI